MFVTIFIYSLRFVDKDADRKVGLFNGLSSTGWIIGFLIPGFFIDRFGISSAFYLILISGLAGTFAERTAHRSWGEIEIPMSCSKPNWPIF
jgi:hypothetical protein